MATSTPDIRKGALAGLAAGLVASLAMDGFQRLFSSPKGMPATEKAAERIGEAVTGEAPGRESRKAGASLIHYATGIGIGIAYGIAAEFAPEVTKGGGTAFSSGVAGLLDEGAVPALRLGPAPWDTDAETHAFGLTSHLVFGVVAEGTRRAARALADRALDT